MNFAIPFSDLDLMMQPFEQILILPEQKAKPNKPRYVTQTICDEDSDPVLPKIVGSSRFRKAVVTAWEKLPRAARQHVGNCVLVEINPNRIQGLCSRPGVQTISIAAGLSGRRLREVILHECAHSFLKHTIGNEATEREARDLSAKWMRLQ